MIKITELTKQAFVLRAMFDKENLPKTINKKQNALTENADKSEVFIYLGKEKDFNCEKLEAAVDALLNYTRDIQVDVKSFVTENIKEECVIESLVEKYEYKFAKLYSIKTEKKSDSINVSLVNTSKSSAEVFKKTSILAQSRNWTRDLQITPPNILNSVKLADTVKKELTKHKNLKITVLTKKEIVANKMGLLLSVNAGSAYEPRVVIIEYKGNASSKETTAIVGKGITFDAGGYNIKTGPHMAGMKYDMSGSAIVAGLMNAVAQLKPKTNVTGVLVATDNMISNIASTPDSVWTAMNGKTVEINNTDAEGRLALADGLTYAATKLGATRLVDIATLTGAVISALGNTYTGVWTTTEKAWTKFEAAAKEANELAWRMPLHNDFIKFMKGSKVADLKNADLTGKGGSSSAAMFLTQFTEGKEYIHLDVAGTADVNDEPKAPMLKTLFELVAK